MKDYSIAGIGEVLWDLFPEYKRLGGGTANFAYHVSQFGFDAAVASALGHDPLGDEVVRTLEDNKVGYLLPQVDFPTGTVQVEVNSDGVPRYDIREQVAWDHIPYTDSLRELARNCCAVCFGSLAQRSEVSRTTINRFLDDTSEESLRIFDINLRQNFYTSETILSSLPKMQHPEAKRRGSNPSRPDVRVRRIEPAGRLPFGRERLRTAGADPHLRCQTAVTSLHRTKVHITIRRKWKSRTPSGQAIRLPEHFAPHCCAASRSVWRTGWQSTFRLMSARSRAACPHCPKA